MTKSSLVVKFNCLISQTCSLLFFLADEKFSKTILLIDDDLKIHIFPETEESVSHLQEKINSIYLHLIDQDTNKIKGYMLREVKGNGKGMAHINEAWTVKFPEDQVIHRIGKTFQRLPIPTTHSLFCSSRIQHIRYKNIRPKLCPKLRIF